MTITRADVESCLAYAVDTGHELLTEICRAWLAVDDSPSGETVKYYFNQATFAVDVNIPAGTYKLVCIETPTGGREGES